MRSRQISDFSDLRCYERGLAVAAVVLSACSARQANIGSSDSDGPSLNEQESSIEPPTSPDDDETESLPTDSELDGSSAAGDEETSGDGNSLPRPKVIIEKDLRYCGFATSLGREMPHELLGANQTLVLPAGIYEMPSLYPYSSRRGISEGTEEVEFPLKFSITRGGEIVSDEVLSPMTWVSLLHDDVTLDEHNEFEVRGRGQEFVDVGGEEWLFRVSLRWENDSTDLPLSLTVGEGDDTELARQAFYILCKSNPYACTVNGHLYTGGLSVDFEQCRFPESPVDRWRVDFEGGFVEFDGQRVNRDRSVAGILLSARGELRGESFEQTDQEKLARDLFHGGDLPTGFAQFNFAAPFEQPIGDACGIAVLPSEPLVPGEKPPWPEVPYPYLFDCEGGVLEILEFVDYSHEIIEDN